MPLTHPRLKREQATLAAMVAIYCSDHHDASGGLCAGCAALLAHAAQRLERCVFQEHKPTCVKCPVHCYHTPYRDLVKAVMRYAGPRMLWRHPLLALRHLLDGRRPAPPLKPAPAKRPLAPSSR